MVRTRRAVLAMGAASLSALAGCSGGNGSDGGDGNGNNGGGGGNSGPFPDHTDVAVFYEKDETVEIPAGSFTSYSIDFENGGALKYDFTVTEGPAIDVLMIRGGEFDYFKEGHQVNYNSAHSIQDASEGSSSADISSGSYRLVFDNSGMGKAQPPTTESTSAPESTDEEETDESEGGDSSGGASGEGTATVELTITGGQ